MLSASALWKQDDHRKIQRMSACRALLAQIFARIKNHAAVNTQAPYISYPVPSFCFGYPLYNVGEAIPYLKETLEEQGYQVWIIHPNTLFISWLKPDKVNNRPIIPKARTNYRPMVYDESSLQILREKME